MANKKEAITYEYLYEYAQERLRFYTDVKFPGEPPPIVTTKEDFKKVLKRWRKRKRFAYDTETNSLRYYKEAQLVGVSVSWGVENTYYIPVGHITDDVVQLPINYVLKRLKPIFEATGVLVIGQNLKFDLHILANYNISVRKRIFDTQVAAHRCDENQDIGLKSLSANILGIRQIEFGTLVNVGIVKDFKKQMGLKGNQKGTIDMVSIHIAGPYALDDAYCTWMLYRYFKPLLIQKGYWDYFNKKDMQFLRCLFDTEREGIQVDMELLKSLDDRIAVGISDLECQIYKAVGHEFKIGSSQQLGNVLFSELGFTAVAKTKTGRPSVDKEALEDIAMKFYKGDKMRKSLDILDKIRDYLKLTRHKTFIKKLYDIAYSDGKIHSSFNQTGTVTGRLSNSDPNLQQIPKASDERDIRHKYNIREVFVVHEPGYRMMGVDESNLELRILAHFSDDANLMDAFSRGQDVHGRTALVMFDLEIPEGYEDEQDDKLKWVKKFHEGMRDAGKTLNFGLIYGLQVTNYCGKMSRTLGREVTEAEGQGHYDKYFSKLPGVERFIKDTKKFAHKYGYVYTISGRKRNLSEINNSKHWVQSRAERQAVNSAIQGSAADIIKEAQIAIMSDPLCKLCGVKVLLQVHDELVMKVKTKFAEIARERVKYFMELPLGVPLDVPLEADPAIGTSWYEVK